METVDGIYLMGAKKMSRRTADRIAKKLAEIAKKHKLEVVMAKAPPVIAEGPYWCSRCKEVLYVCEARVARTDVPTCPFCENTDRVSSMTE